MRAEPGVTGERVGMVAVSGFVKALEAAALSVRAYALAMPAPGEVLRSPSRDSGQALGFARDDIVVGR